MNVILSWQKVMDGKKFTYKKNYFQFEKQLTKFSKKEQQVSTQEICKFRAEPIL